MHAGRGRVTRRSKPLTTNPQSVRDYRDSNLSWGDVVPNLALHLSEWVTLAKMRIAGRGMNERANKVGAGANPEFLTSDSRFSALLVLISLICKLIYQAFKKVPTIWFKNQDIYLQGITVKGLCHRCPAPDALFIRLDRAHGTSQKK